MPSQTDRLIELFRQTSFKSSPTPVFKLAAGGLSRWYVDCKMALSYPEARQLVGERIVEKLGSAPADAVGGLALGAWPIALAVSDAAWRLSGRTIRTFVVRKEPKDHGTGKFIEGDVKAGDRTIIVDDVVTTGMSTITAVERCRAAGLEVARIFAIVDRQESGGRESLEKLGVPFEVLFTLADLRARAE